MTIDEINRKISELRKEWLLLTGGDWILYKLDDAKQWLTARPVNWLDDANWPTLLREMSHARIERRPYIAGPRTWYCVPANNDAYGEAADVAEAVCLAWLKWKTGMENS